MSPGDAPRRDRAYAHSSIDGGRRCVDVEAHPRLSTSRPGNRQPNPLGATCHPLAKKPPLGNPGSLGNSARRAGSILTGDGLLPPLMLPTSASEQSRKAPFRGTTL
jgi:hypothetical protein